MMFDWIEPDMLELDENGDIKFTDKAKQELGIVDAPVYSTAELASYLTSEWDETDVGSGE